MPLVSRDMRISALIVIIALFLIPELVSSSITQVKPTEFMVIDYGNALLTQLVLVSPVSEAQWYRTKEPPRGFLVPQDALSARAESVGIGWAHIDPGTYVFFYDEQSNEQVIRSLIIRYRWNGTIPPVADERAALAVVNPPGAIRIDRQGSIIRTNDSDYAHEPIAYYELASRGQPLFEAKYLSTHVQTGDTINLRTGPTRWHIITWQEYLILSTIVLGIILFAVLPSIIVARVPERTIIWTGAGVITTAIILITSTNNYAQGFVMPLFNKLPFIGLLALTGYAVSSIGSFFIIYKRTTLLKTIGTLITALVLLFVAVSIYFAMTPMILY